MASVPLIVGLRYAGTGKKQFLSVVSRVSLIGLVLGVVALAVVVSVMNGFDRELKHRILGAVPHVMIETKEPAALRQWLAASKDVAGFAPFLRRSGLVIHGQQTRLVSVYGVEPGKEQSVSIVPDHMVSGDLASLSPGTNRVVLGRPLAFQLGIVTGDTITLIIPEPSRGGNAVTPRMARLVVAGFFELDSELDYKLLMIDRHDLSGIVRDAGDETWRVTLHDIFRAPAFAAEAMKQQGVTGVSTWTDDYGDFFRTVRMEKIMMFVLLTLIVAIAAFNIVSGLSMMVKEKQADIAVLRTLGLSPGQVMQTFVIQGAIVGVAGTLIGMVIGLPLAYWVGTVVRFFEDLSGTRLLAGTYFDRVPSDLRTPDFAVIVLVSLLISLLATLYPSYRASRLRPAEVLRYE